MVAEDATTDTSYIINPSESEEDLSKVPVNINGKDEVVSTYLDERIDIPDADSVSLEVLA